MTEQFDPNRLTPAASTNNVVIAQLPEGVQVDAHVLGKRADELVSLAALNRLVLGHADALKLPDDLQDDPFSRRLPLWFDTCFESGSVYVRKVASSITAQFGRRIGAVLAVLIRGDEANRAARENTLAGYWEHWNTVEKVILGGGLLAGHMGERVIPHVREVMSAANVGHVVVEHDLHFDTLPMFGAARTITIDKTDYMVPVFDFGRSSVKRGVAVYRDSELREIKILPTIPASLEDEYGRYLDEVPEDHLNRIRDIVANTIALLRDSDAALEDDVAMSIAAYIQDGEIAHRSGGYYTHLRELQSPLEQLISAGVSDVLQSETQVNLVHDGTASALFYAGEENTAVLSIGTGIGTGFAPPDEKGLTPLAHDLRLSVFHTK